MTASDLADSRHRMDLSQAKLAEILGYDVTTISRMERGKLAIPRHIEYAVRYIEFLKVKA